MTHRVSQRIFRIGDVTNWSSRWLTKKNVPQYLEEDFKIRRFLKKRLKDCGLDDVEIERFSGKVNIIIQTSRPGLVIGRGGEGIENIKKDLIKDVWGKGILSGRKNLPEGDKKEIRIEIQEIRNPWLRASLVGQWAAKRIERKFYFRRVMKETLDKIIANKEVKGARVEISGRLGGSEHARKEWLKKGNLPRQSLRADIDYALTEAHCSYGVLGIKVWIYKGERFAKNASLN